MNRRKFLQILGATPLVAVFPALAGRKEKELCAYEVNQRMEEEKRNSQLVIIDGATLVQGPEMTATEVIARMKEHAQSFEMTW